MSLTKLVTYGFIGAICFLEVSARADETAPVQTTTAVAEKVVLEKKQAYNPFSVLPFQPIYVLPFFYSPTSNPDDLSSLNHSDLKKTEFKFQISLKSAIWQGFFAKDNILYIAYTQQSFWQSYNHSPFFRTNNFEPEIFLENNVNIHLPLGWKLQLISPGAVHQSNGRGDNWERSWNRLYVDFQFSHNDLLVSLKPWYIIKEKSLNYNPDIAHYMGHGSLLVSYRRKDNVFTLMTYNNFESGFQRGATQFTWSFPLVNKIRGYSQFFRGYGQNLLQYNHRSTNVGFGVALSDWI